MSSNTNNLIDTLESRQMFSAAVPTVAGYLPDYGASHAMIDRIDFGTINQLNYFSVVPDANGNIAGANGEAANSLTGPGYGLDLLRYAEDVAHAKGAKISIVIGGAGTEHAFETILNDATKRDTFARSVKQFAETYDLDGVDFDYEPPGGRGATDAQIEGYGQLIKAVNDAAPSLKLSTAVAPETIPTANPLFNEDGSPALDWKGHQAYGEADWSPTARRYVLDDVAVKNLDEIGVMTYDFTQGAGNADLARSIQDMNDWAKYVSKPEIGGNREQILLGLPFYGRSGPADWSNAPSGIASYSDIVKGYQARNGNAKPAASANSAVASIADTGASHALDNQAVTWHFDGPNMIEAKTKAAVNARVGGVMIWDLAQDHFRADGSYSPTSSLLPAVARGLPAKAATPAPTPTPAPSPTPTPTPAPTPAPTPTPNPTPTPSPTPSPTPTPVPAATGRISGTVFFDGNADGVYNNWDNPSTGRVVFLDLDNDHYLDSGERSTTTDADGNYAFNGLAAGTHNVTLQSVSWFYGTSRMNAPVTLGTAQRIVGIDFGEWGNW